MNKYFVILLFVSFRLQASGSGGGPPLPGDNVFSAYLLDHRAPFGGHDLSPDDSDFLSLDDGGLGDSDEFPGCLPARYEDDLFLQCMTGGLQKQVDDANEQIARLQAQVDDANEQKAKMNERQLLLERQLTEASARELKFREELSKLRAQVVASTSALVSEVNGGVKKGPSRRRKKGAKYNTEERSKVAKEEGCGAHKAVQIIKERRRIMAEQSVSEKEAAQIERVARKAAKLASQAAMGKFVESMNKRVEDIAGGSKKRARGVQGENL